MKRILPVIICIGIIISLCACGAPKDDSATTQKTTSAVVENNTTTEEVTDPSTEAVTIPATEGISDTVEAITPAPPPAATEPETVPPTEETTIGKTGEMAFSDSPDNRYIKSIADKYSVNAENLVAIYTVPQNDSNMVLEFSGKTDASGKLVRNSSTLVAIYTIDASLVSKRASKDNSKNEYPSGEAMVMFMTVTTYIMPEFRDKL
jgi:hypothetical protein